ncbi:hypothetical protein [Ruminiclostridium papyrosolvens]|uniref:DUF5668 domain-containing protein n=1 Tax=Ruminiclostridium papyrosolvens C7 TaxID=1330534 RepID=U4R5T8_9FIRM|nr:hypothetical protein [Ruminiclostridium papyrosolvens]EPR13282.1 hypothetical protein L323_05215 [Ruminiclostridium papyrosolvens C7]
MKKSYSLVGTLLIGAGALLLVLKMLFGINFLDLNTGDFWVFIVLLIGLTFEFSYFLTGRKPGLLIPGGIITTIGLLFMFEVATNWYFAEYTWPVYILSVAVGLFQMYLFSNREKGLLIASVIIAGISAFFFACMFFNTILTFIKPSLFIPVALIAAGIAIFASGKKTKGQW